MSIEKCKDRLPGRTFGKAVVCCCITVLLCCCITVLLYYCITVFLHCCITALLYYTTRTGCQVGHSVKQLCTSVLLYYCVTVLLYYCITSLLYYCITVLLYSCTCVLAAQGFCASSSPARAFSERPGGCYRQRPPPSLCTGSQYLGVQAEAASQLVYRQSLPRCTGIGRLQDCEQAVAASVYGQRPLPKL